MGVNFQYWSLFLPLFDLREQKSESKPKILSQNYFFCQRRGYLKMWFEQSYCGCKNFRLKKKCFWGFFWFFKVARKSQFWPFLAKNVTFFVKNISFLGHKCNFDKRKTPAAARRHNNKGFSLKDYIFFCQKCDFEQKKKASGTPEEQKNWFKQKKRKIC